MFLTKHTLESLEGLKHLRSALRMLNGGGGNLLPLSELSFVEFIASRRGSSLYVLESDACPGVMTVCGSRGPIFAAHPNGFVAGVSPKEVREIVREIEALNVPDDEADREEHALVPLLPQMPHGSENKIVQVEAIYGQTELNALAQRQPIFVVYEGAVLRLQAVVDSLPRKDEFKVFTSEDATSKWVERGQLFKLMFEPQSRAEVLEAKAAIEEFISKPTHWACRRVVELESFGRGTGAAYSIEIAQFMQGEGVGTKLFALTSSLEATFALSNELYAEAARQGSFLEQHELHKRLKCFYVGAAY